MIGESHFWKADLAKTAAWLREKKEQKRWTDRSFFLVERSCMTAAFAIRKLIESKKLTTALAESRMKVGIAPSTGSRVTRVNSSSIDRHYDFEKETESSVSVVELCNQIIHSYVFIMIRVEEGGLFEFIVSSDRQRGKGAFVVPVDPWIELLERVAADNVNYMESRWSEELGDYDMLSFSSKAEAEGSEGLQKDSRAR